MASLTVDADTRMADGGKRKRNDDVQASRDGLNASTSAISTIEDYATPEVTFARVVSEASEQPSSSLLMNCKEPPLRTHGVTVLQNQSQGDNVTMKRQITLQPYSIGKVSNSLKITLILLTTF